MGFNRSEAKMNVRSSMRQTRPGPIVVTLVFLLLTLGVTNLVLWVTGNPMTEMTMYLQMGYGIDEVIEYVLLGNPGRVGIFWLLSLLITIYEVVMDFGYTSYALRMERNEQPDYSNLFDGFARVGRVLWAGILIEIFTTLWGLLFMIPGWVAIGAAIVLSLENEMTAGIMLLIALFLMLVGCILMIAVTYRYRLTSYFLLDDPDCTARQAIRRSKEAMRGWKMEMFALDLSFLGWVLLTILTFGILSVWLLPYAAGAEAALYDHITAASRGSGSYAGGQYDYRVGEDPSPFQ